MNQDRTFLRQLTLNRANRLLARIRATFWTAERDIPAYASDLFELEKAPADAAGLTYRPIAAGEHFGSRDDPWKQRWFKVEIPEAAKEERGKRVLFWDCQGEHTMFIGGKPWSGTDVGHPWCDLPDSAETVYIDCGAYVTGIWVPGASR